MAEVSDADRRTMASLARDLAEAETDRPLPDHLRARHIAAAAEWRAARGIPPLTPDEDPPEEEFYRRARQLGFC